jgi:hypothetical protein
MSKFETISNYENSNDQNKIMTCVMSNCIFVFIIGTFVFRICFGFRASGFEFTRHAKVKMTKTQLAANLFESRPAFAFKRFRVGIRYMALPAITPRGMLGTNDRHCTRAYMACDAIASHLKIMGNRRRCPGQVCPAQTGRRDAHPVAGNERFGLRLRDVALSAGSLLRMGR